MKIIIIKKEASKKKEVIIIFVHVCTYHMMGGIKVLLLCSISFDTNTVYYYNFDLLIAFSRFPDEYEYDRGVHSFPFHTHSIHQQRKDIQLCLFRYCSHSNAYKIENKQTFTHLIYRNNIIQFMSVDKSTKNEAIFFFILHHCRIARMKKQTFFVFHFYYFLIFVLLTYTCLNNEKVAHSCKYWLKPNVNNFVSISLKNKKTNAKKIVFSFVF